MSRALASPAIVAGLLVALAVLVAPSRRGGFGGFGGVGGIGGIDGADDGDEGDEGDRGDGGDGRDGRDGRDGGDGRDGRDGVRARGAPWFERTAPPDPATADEVNAALVLLALGYRSGLPTWEVLGAVADVLQGSADRHDAPVARDLRQVAAALRWGASDNAAWASVGHVWSAAGRAVAIAHRAGIPPGPLLVAAAEDLRRESLEQVELEGARVGVRLVAPLGLVLLPAFCLTTVIPLVVALAGQILAG